jgi:Ca-activated chloride channel family protein
MMVTFMWGKLLWLLVSVPVLVAGYVYVLHRRKPALRYSSVGVVRLAMGGSQPLRRHLPAAFLLLALVSLLIASARPAADLTLLSDQRTIILAIDVSMSMRATDVAPSRIEAARRAAKAFIDSLPRHVQIGVVTFAGQAHIVQVPTRNRQYLHEALDHLYLDYDTAIGTGLLASLVALYPTAGIEGNFDLFGMNGWKDGGREVAQPVAFPLWNPFDSRKPSRQRLPPGSAPAAIVLMTDGRSMSGMDPVMAARRAADLGVRVYTVGFGTEAMPTVETFDGAVLNTGFDEETLKEVARVTRGKYFHADTALSLETAYQSITPQVAPVRNKETEVTVLFSAIGAILMLAAMTLSLRWQGPVA